MPASVVVGAQWGDEGKGKVVDLLSPQADVVVRYAGGANAGHTLVVEGKKIVLHLVPSGVLHEGCVCIVGQGTVVDPGTLLEELRELDEGGVNYAGRLLVCRRAHVVMPYHKCIDGLREAGAGAIGTTKRGIGPTYEDKAGRRGVRVGNLTSERLPSLIDTALRRWGLLAKALGDGDALPSAEQCVRQAREWGEQLAPLMADGGEVAGAALEAGKKVLFEGAQGTMLDVDQGTYPFVTSSNAVAGGACTGSGLGPTAIERVIGITKAYTTRVGEGPFPTELNDETGEAIRARGAEFGATTGRPRRCGWLDLPALRLAVRANGLTSIALTKLDVLSGLSEVRLATAYEVNGAQYETPPFDGYDAAKPVYETLPGWKEDISECRSRDELPETARRYVDRIETLAGCAISIVSVGPDRRETFGEFDPFA
ncbi:MAG: adenylosuccinate synthase [Myxococcota bacterium]